MNAAQLFYDVDKRLRADTGTNGLFPAGAAPLVSGIFNNWSSPTQTMPYIVWTLVSGVDDGTFDTNEDDIQFQLSVFASKRPPQLATAQRIINRIYGNGVKQSSRLPTFGLHRHTLVSTWPDDIETTDACFLHTDGVVDLVVRELHVVEEHVDHAGHGVRSLDRRCTIGHHLDACRRTDRASRPRSTRAG